MNNTHIIIIVLAVVLIAMMFMRQRQESFSSRTVWYVNLVKQEDIVVYEHTVKLIQGDKNDFLWHMNKAVRAYDRIGEIAKLRSNYGKNPILDRKQMIIFAQNLVKKFIVKKNKNFTGPNLEFNDVLLRAYLTLHTLVWFTYLDNYKFSRSQSFNNWLNTVANIPNSKKGNLTDEAIRLYAGLREGFQYLGYGTSTPNNDYNEWKKAREDWKNSRNK